MATDINSRLSFLRRHSIAVFFVLAFVLGTSTSILVVLGVLPPGLALASALSASIAGVIMTAIEDGKTGLKLMFGRLLIWRVGIEYWLFALLFLLPTIIIGSLTNPLFNGEQVTLSNINPAYQILPMFIIFFIVAGLGEELGWTGFLTPRLQTRFNALTSCIIRALLVAIWHLPLFILAWMNPLAFPDFPYGSWIADKGFLTALATATFMFILPWSIFFGWIFNNTKGSLLLIAILHGSEIWVVFWMLSAGINPENLNNYWGYGIIMVLIATTIVIRTGPQNLSRKHKRIIHR